MLPLKKPASKTAVSDGSKANGRVLPQAGLLLLDTSLKLIAADRGGAAILNSDDRKPGAGAAPVLPAEIIDVIRGHKPDEFPWTKSPFCIHGREYVLRAYMIQAHNGVLPRPILALHLEHDSFTNAVVEEVGSAYNLTLREQEAFAGILMGLSTKEVAQRMNISPNTVKAFLRLIMIKMGVTTRAGILARILHDRTAPEPESSEAAASGA